MSEPSNPPEKPSEPPKPKDEKKIIEKAAEAAHKAPPKKNVTNLPQKKKNQGKEPMVSGEKPGQVRQASKPTTGMKQASPKEPAKYVRKSFFLRRRG